MNVVGHQHIGMDAATGLGGVFGEPVEIKAIVLVAEEARLAIVAALDEMEGNTRQGQASAAWNISEEEQSPNFRKPWCPLLSPRQLQTRSERFYVPVLAVVKQQLIRGDQR